jgi:hypothetical protein
MILELQRKWLIWCGLNAEQDALEKVFGRDCVSIRGSTPNDKKIELERLWREGDVPIMITKPVIFGYGLNWQHCADMAFVGLTDSFEQIFQAVRRCYRFGQQSEVNAHMIVSDLEGAVSENIKRKERDFELMAEEMLKHTRKITGDNIKATASNKTDYVPRFEMTIPTWLRSEQIAS